jgi:hypothetical protein
MIPPENQVVARAVVDELWRRIFGKYYVYLWLMSAAFFVGLYLGSAWMFILPIGARLGGAWMLVLLICLANGAIDVGTVLVLYVIGLIIYFVFAFIFGLTVGLAGYMLAGELQGIKVMLKRVISTHNLNTHSFMTNSINGYNSNIYRFKSYSDHRINKSSYDWISILMVVGVIVFFLWAVLKTNSAPYDPHAKYLTPPLAHTWRDDPIVKPAHRHERFR